MTTNELNGNHQDDWRKAKNMASAQIRTVYILCHLSHWKTLNPLYN